MTTEHTNSRLSDDERRDFLKVLGVTGAAATGGAALEDVTLSDLREAVTVESTGEFARRGEAIRNGLTGELNAELVGAEMAGVADAIDRLPEVRTAGIPERGEELYAELTGAAWAIDDHLAEVGFYASTEANLPRFGSSHIEAMARHLVRAEALETALSEVGFDAREQTEAVANVVRQSDHLAMWQPTWGYEDVEGGDEFEVEPEYVPPLHRRAAAGALLWIDGLDKHLRQKQVLITDQMLDDGIADVRAMLGGFYLLSDAASRLATGDIADEELTALVSGSTAMLIASQTDLQYDLVRITDEMRAPRTGGD
ncbi:twin-arginine translocation signal domain-containing protein [Halorussus lipolyticus]|uniref:twin-arginine translocation signal domain-containing protein n=1 Tax=Halorussus lipolyticus TaxID=3034024 RepID=UPI0023E8F0ED|nr:twin-arginine translocation signal domain-containing protein [Halorussus sp. DT80]